MKQLLWHSATCYNIHVLHTELNVAREIMAKEHVERFSEDSAVREFMCTEIHGTQILARRLYVNRNLETFMIPIQYQLFVTIM